MKKVAVIVPNGESVLSSIVGPHKIFNRVNDFLTQQGGSPYYEIILVGDQPSNELYGGFFSVKIEQHISQVDHADLVIIPAILGDITLSLERNKGLVQWIKKMRFAGAEIASLCMGAFLLAETGLLDGKSCTTHWIGVKEFKYRYPLVHLYEQKILTEENGIYTSGGAYSFLNLLLYLVEKFNGREMALLCSKLFEIDINRDNQSQFVIFNAQHDHADESIQKAQAYIERNYAERISVEQLAKMFALSRRSFVRRFKKATQNTPLEYIQRVKVEAAKKSLESSNNNVSEVMYLVGYSDSKAFRNTFKRITGLSPNEYRGRYNRTLAIA